MCGKPEWHRRAECEDTDELEARRFQKLKSDLFKTHGTDLPARQKQSLAHNTGLPFLRLPPEIRRRIYTLLFGAQTIWIGHWPEQRRWNYVYRDRHGKNVDHNKDKWLYMASEHFHRGGHFHLLTSAGETSLDLRLLGTCRSMYIEAALLPYWLNRFVFQDEAVRRRFEKSARAGKKRAQKAAVGTYGIMDGVTFEQGGWQVDREGLSG